MRDAPPEMSPETTGDVAAGTRTVRPARHAQSALPGSRFWDDEAAFVELAQAFGQQSGGDL